MAKKKKVVNNLSGNLPGRGGYFIRRVLAFGIDWYLSALLANIAISLCYGFFNQGQIEVQYSLDGMTNTQSWILMAVLFLIFLFYYVYVPCRVWVGQTPAQRMLQLKVFNDDQSDVTFKTMLFRFVIGCLVLEGTFYFFTSTFKTLLITKYLPLDTGMMDMLLSGPIAILCVISLLLAFRDKKQSRMLHDRISHTHVEDIYVAGKIQKAL